MSVLRCQWDLRAPKSHCYLPKCHLKPWWNPLLCCPPPRNVLSFMRVFKHGNKKKKVSWTYVRTLRRLGNRWNTCIAHNIEAMSNSAFESLQNFDVEFCDDWCTLRYIRVANKPPNFKKDNERGNDLILGHPDLGEGTLTCDTQHVASLSRSRTRTPKTRLLWPRCLKSGGLYTLHFTLY